VKPLRTIVSFLGMVAAIAAIVMVADHFATDGEVEAGLKAQKRMTDLEYYSRRIEAAEMRVELHCNIKRDANLCPYWRKQLMNTKNEREDFLRGK